MSDPILHDLWNRYTCKSYDPTRKVPEEKLQILYEALRLTPSSINSQPWKFIVISSDKAKRRLYDTFTEPYHFNRQYVLDSTVTILFAHNPKYRLENYEEVVKKMIEDGRIPPEKKERALQSFRFARMHTDESGFNGHWTKAQLYIALGNAYHTLARLEIDSTALEGIDVERVEAEFKEELGGFACHVALCIGYHQATDYNAKLPKSRLEHDSIFIHL